MADTARPEVPLTPFALLAVFTVFVPFAVAACGKPCSSTRDCAIDETCSAGGQCVPFTAPAGEGEAGEGEGDAGEGEGDAGEGEGDAGEGEGEGDVDALLCGNPAFVGDPAGMYMLGAPNDTDGVDIWANADDTSDYAAGFTGFTERPTIAANGRLVAREGGIVAGDRGFYVITPDAHAYDADFDFDGIPEPKDCNYSDSGANDDDRNDTRLVTDVCDVNLGTAFLVLRGGSVDDYAYHCFNDDHWYDPAGNVIPVAAGDVYAYAADGAFFVATVPGAVVSVPGVADTQLAFGMTSPVVLAAREVGDGFLAVVRDGNAPTLPVLFAVTTAGAVTSRGAFQGLTTDLTRFGAIDGAGDFYDLGNADGVVTRYSVGAAPVVVYDPAGGNGLMDRPSELFSGGSASGF